MGKGRERRGKEGGGGGGAIRRKTEKDNTKTGKEEGEEREIEGTKGRGEDKEKHEKTILRQRSHFHKVIEPLTRKSLSSTEATHTHTHCIVEGQL